MFAIAINALITITTEESVIERAIVFVIVMKINTYLLLIIVFVIAHIDLTLSITSLCVIENVIELKKNAYN